MILLKGELHTDESGEVVIPLEGALPLEDVTAEIGVIVEGVEVVAKSVVLKLDSDLHLLADAEVKTKTGTDARAEVTLHIVNGEAAVASDTEEHIRAKEAIRIVVENIADVSDRINTHLGIVELTGDLALIGRIVTRYTANTSTKVEPRCNIVSYSYSDIRGDMLKMTNCPIIGSHIINTTHHTEIPSRSEVLCVSGEGQSDRSEDSHKNLFHYVRILIISYFKTHKFRNNS